MNYQTTITKIGDMVLEFMDQGIIIVYDDYAPSELAELSVLHTPARLDQDVRVGDHVIWGDNDYIVTAVGSQANDTLRKMGHCTFGFTGAIQAALPGSIELEGNGMPRFQMGDKFEILPCR